MISLRPTRPSNTERVIRVAFSTGNRLALRSTAISSSNGTIAIETQPVCLGGSMNCIERDSKNPPRRHLA